MRNRAKQDRKEANGEEHPYAEARHKLRTVPKDSPKERSQRAARGFILRVGFLLLLIGSLAYVAWFAPWAKPIRTLDIEMEHPIGTQQ